MASLKDGELQHASALACSPYIIFIFILMTILWTTQSVAYLGFHKGGDKFSQATSAYTKGQNHDCFSYFFLWRIFLPKGVMAKCPLKRPWTQWKDSYKPRPGPTRAGPTFLSTGLGIVDSKQVWEQNNYNNYLMPKFDRI